MLMQRHQGLPCESMRANCGCSVASKEADYSSHAQPDGAV